MLARVVISRLTLWLLSEVLLRALVAITVCGLSHWREPSSRGHVCFEVCFGLTGRGPVSSSRCGQGSQVRGCSRKLSILYIQQPEWNLPEPSEPSSPFHPRLSTVPPQLAAFARVFWVTDAAGKIRLCFLASLKGNVAGGDRFERLSCFKYSEKRDQI